MSIKSRGRGTAALFGMLLVVAGLIGGALLYVLSVRRPGQAVDHFARAPVGCTTTLEFTETGTFYVYAEDAAQVTPPAGDCEPTGEPGRAFGFELTGSGGAVVPKSDESVEYDSGGRTGRSIARFDIDTAGSFEIAVVGDDPAVVAAVGRDPQDGVDELRRGALIVAIAGVLLGALLLAVAGRRSSRAATFAPPVGPGWDLHPPSETPSEWPPAPPHIAQVPVNPHRPNEPASPTPPPPPLPARRPPTSTPPSWGPPPADEASSAVSEPPLRPTPPPELKPMLPDRRIRTSGDVVPGGPEDRRSDGVRDDA